MAPANDPGHSEWDVGGGHAAGGGQSHGGEPGGTGVGNGSVAVGVSPA